MHITADNKDFRENLTDKIDGSILKVAPCKGHCKVDMVYFLLKSSASAFYETKIRDYDFLGYVIQLCNFTFLLFPCALQVTINNDFSIELGKRNF